MSAYLIRRLLLVIPTLWAIITINFLSSRSPRRSGGPGDCGNRIWSRWRHAGRRRRRNGASHARTGVGNISESHYRGGRGLDPEVIAEITHRYGFEAAARALFQDAMGLCPFRFWRQPVSQRLGVNPDQTKPAGFHHARIVGTLIIYLVSIPLGIRKAVYNGSRFDIWSSTFIIIGYAIPAFLFAVLLIVFSQAAVISTSSRCAGWSPRISARCRGIRKSPITSGTSRCRCWRRSSAVLRRLRC